MKRIEALGFEEKYQENIDPWDYTNSRFEHFKRDALLQACGHYKHGRVLELGCAIGETTRFLAPLSLRLLALDGSPTAISEAKKRVLASHIRFLQAVLPSEMPPGPFDLIVVSEVAYYLRAVDLAALAKKIALCVARRGRIVLLHHRRHFPDAAQPGELAQAQLVRQLRSVARPVYRKRYPQFDVVTLRRSSGQRRLRRRPRSH
jgi:SAM-dependent methyltransferase